MLIRARTLKGYKLDSLDGEIGKTRECYFDDRHWTVRYLVADTGNWLTGRQVLISPYALVEAIQDDHSISVNLTKLQIENSPSLDSDVPVSRQFEEDYYGYYGWPTYWSGPFMWGFYSYLNRGPENWEKYAQSDKAWDPHLRSTHEVSGYDITEDWYVRLSCNYVHVSNAALSEPQHQNKAIDALGPQVGVGYRF